MGGRKWKRNDGVIYKEWERNKEHGKKEIKDMEGIKQWKKGVVFPIIFHRSYVGISVHSTVYGVVHFSFSKRQIFI